MSIVINTGGVHSSFASARSASTVPASAALRRTGGVEPIVHSPFGPSFSLGIDESSFRIARIQSIRAQIGGGTFETQERIEGTVSRLLAELA